MTRFVKYVIYLLIFGLPLWFCMINMKLKYQAHIDQFKLSECPPQTAKGFDGIAFRWVQNPISSDDFISYAALGKIPRATEKSHYLCAWCGLSMFDTEEKARDKYYTLPTRRHLPYTHIASGKITTKDGLCTSPKGNGHFTLHEFVNVDLSTSFNIIAQI